MDVIPYSKAVSRYLPVKSESQIFFFIFSIFPPIVKRPERGSFLVISLNTFWWHMAPLKSLFGRLSVFCVFFLELHKSTPLHDLALTLLVSISLLNNVAKTKQSVPISLKIKLYPVKYLHFSHRKWNFSTRNTIIHTFHCRSN